MLYPLIVLTISLNGASAAAGHPRIAQPGSKGAEWTVECSYYNDAPRMREERFYFSEGGSKTLAESRIYFDDNDEFREVRFSLQPGESAQGTFGDSNLPGWAKDMMLEHDRVAVRARECKRRATEPSQTHFERRLK